MNTATTTSTAIHKAELLRCGCRVDVKTGARFITCPAHSNIPAVDPLAKKDGLKPLCTRCMSQRLVPIQNHIECKDCGHCFNASEITDYGVSFPDSACLACGKKHFGNGSVCSFCLRQEDLL